MKVLKYALIFLAGGGIGFGVGATIFSIKAAKIAKEHEKELAEMDEYYKKRIDALTWEDDEEKEEESHQEVPEKATAPAEKRGGPFKTPYGSYYPNAKTPDPAEREHPTDDSAPVYVKQQPRLIKSSDYGMDNNSTKTLYYYTVDDALIPEESSYEDIIDTDEVKDMLGNALVKYGFTHPDNQEKEIYVRNYNRKCDYRIIKVIGSLSEDYGG